MTEYKLKYGCNPNQNPARIHMDGKELPFTVLNGSDTTIGKPWLYAEETDFFVECEIPGYDENTIWFVRTVQGGWFSIDVQSSWQSGYLDVDGSIYNEVKKWFEEEYHNNWYDEQLKAKGELI